MAESKEVVCPFHLGLVRSKTSADPLPPLPLPLYLTCACVTPNVSLSLCVGFDCGMWKESERQKFYVDGRRLTNGGNMFHSLGPSYGKVYSLSLGLSVSVVCVLTSLSVADF